ncbi:hypothetical protein [Bradyrhizobium genosp. A]|uniref:hypothetical protein n=1 Tax=Bradyrhizobium genosp. A TaxID=83626 RepID=UPI003CEA0270
MTRLIVTTDSSIAGAIQQAGLADLVIAIERRLVWGQLPSEAELEAFVAPRTTRPHGLHWLDDTPSWCLDLEMHNDSNRLQRYKQSRLSLTEFGKAVLGGDENFRRHNRIDRWWGGTRTLRTYSLRVFLYCV